MRESSISRTQGHCIAALLRFFLGVTIALSVIGLFGCEDDEGDDQEGGPMSVTYESRTTGCNDPTWGPLEEDCQTLQYPKDDLTLDDMEDQWSGLDISCLSDCCITIERINVHAFYGTCP